MSQLSYAINPSFHAERFEMDFEVSDSSVPSRCQALNEPPSHTDLCFFPGDSITFSCFSRRTRTPGTINPGGFTGTYVLNNAMSKDLTLTCNAMNECGNDTETLLVLIQGR